MSDDYEGDFTYKKGINLYIKIYCKDISIWTCIFQLLQILSKKFLLDILQHLLLEQIQNQDRGILLIL